MVLWHFLLSDTEVSGEVLISETRADHVLLIKSTITSERRAPNFRADFSFRSDEASYYCDVENTGDEPFQLDGSTVRPRMSRNVVDGSKLTLSDGKQFTFRIRRDESVKIAGTDSEVEGIKTDDEKSGREAEIAAKISSLQRKFENKRELSPAAPPSAMKRFRSAAMKMGWASLNNRAGQLSALVYNSHDNVEASSKIAGYDLDGTLITPRSGARFPKDKTDWTFLYPQVPGKVKSAHRDGFKIVVFTNQKGLLTNKITEPDLKWKIEAVARKLAVPLQVFVSARDDVNRKPVAGAWFYLARHCNGGEEIDLEASHYVGDAAGRKAGEGKSERRDFGCSDRLFALNVGLPRRNFSTPERHFLGKKDPRDVKTPEFDPRSLRERLGVAMPTVGLGQEVAMPTVGRGQEVAVPTVGLGQEVIVMVGCPASGKSHYVRSRLVPRGYDHINRDALGSQQRCVNRCRSAVAAGRSVVVDNTNVERSSRKLYLDLCRDVPGVECRCFVMDVTKPHTFHNNQFRRIVASGYLDYWDDDDDNDDNDDNGDDADTIKAHKGVNDMILHSMWSKYEDPNVSEGFDEIVKVPFIPKFGRKFLERLYYWYLTG